MSSEETKTFTRAEVAKHNTNKDTWLLIHNNIYDVTAFLNEVRIARNTSQLSATALHPLPPLNGGHRLLLGLIWVSLVPMS